MKSYLSLKTKSSGSALMAVIIFSLILLLLTGSFLQYSVTERRINEYNRLLLRARSEAENLSLYAAEQLTQKLYRSRSASLQAFIGGVNQIAMPPTSGPNQVLPPFVIPSSLEVFAGLTTANSLAPITDPTDTNYGLYVSQNIVQIIAKASVLHPHIGSVTNYNEQDMQLALMPLFQFALFYNMDLEISPGGDMTITGPVHANGNLITRSQTGKSNTIQFTGRVTASGGFYADTAYKGNIYNEYGNSDNGPGGTGQLLFQDTSGIVTNINSGSLWRDQKWGTPTETTSTDTSFKSFATNTYVGNFRTGLHGVTRIYPPGITPTSPPNIARSVTITPPAVTDSAAVIQSRFARKAGLYIIVNPTGSNVDRADNNRLGILPDGTTVLMPPYSYRCWLNSVDDSGNHTMTEVVLPGQPSYGNLNGTQNNLPNRFTDKTAILSNQVLRIPNSGTAFIAGFALAGTTTGYAIGAPTFLTNTSTPLSDAYFYDLRRANNSTGNPFNRASNTFQPRPIAKIDFDWTRFRLMVERTVQNLTISSASIYWPNQVRNWNTYNTYFPNIAPLNNTTNQWNTFIYNPNATPTAFRLGINFGPTSANTFSDFPVAGTALNGSPNNPGYTADPFRLYFATGAPVTAGDLAGAAHSPWFDGITVYIHSVDAEDLSGTAGVRDRTDSGVRLINGRGPLISLSGTTYPNCTGSNFCTNDAVYILGHYNANGTVNSNTSATGFGGYSGIYPDTNAEMLTVVQGDAITILSQPVFTQNGGNPYQTDGWSDSMSGHRPDNGTWSTNWATTNPSSSNPMDGISTSIRPGDMPTLTAVGTIAPAQSFKFDPSVTEISSCLLTGIVQTNASQHSGGAHNFPRLLERWNGTGLYIRGSMVAMFDSAIATEPWSIRIYSAAGRFWGFNINLASPSHDVPLEPIMASTSRLRYFQISPATYSALSTTIQSLPH